MCSLSLSANQPAVLFSHILNQHQPLYTSQSAVLFSRNKSAPAISYSQANTANSSQIVLTFFFSLLTLLSPSPACFLPDHGSTSAPRGRSEPQMPSAAYGQANRQSSSQITPSPPPPARQSTAAPCRRPPHGARCLWAVGARQQGLANAPAAPSPACWPSAHPCSRV